MPLRAHRGKLKPIFTLNLGVYIIPVYWDSTPLHESRVEGWWEPDNNIIFINQNLDPQAFFDVLIHECVEAINSKYALSLPHPKIQMLGIGLTQMLKPFLRRRK